MSSLVCRAPLDNGDVCGDTATSLVVTGLSHTWSHTARPVCERHFRPVMHWVGVFLDRPKYEVIRIKE